MTRYHRKHKHHGTPAPEHSKLTPKGKHKKAAPRYRVERYYTAFWKGGKGSWLQIGAARDLAEAKHLMLKPARDVWYRNTVDVRIIDARTEEVIASAHLHPKAAP